MKVNFGSQKIDYTGYSNSILPKDMLVSIFKYCSLKILTTHCSLVCKRWNQVSSFNVIWEDLFKRHFPDSYQRLEFEPNSLEEYFFKKAYEQYCVADSRLRQGQFNRDFNKFETMVTCLKNFSGKFAGDFFDKDPNLVRIHKKDLYQGIGQEIKIVEALSKKSKIIKLNEFSKDYEIISMTIDKLKDHLYLRYYDPSEQNKDLIAIMNIKDQKLIKYLIEGDAYSKAKEIHGITLIPESFNMRIHRKWFVEASDNRLQVWDIEKGHRLMKTFIFEKTVNCFKLYDNKLFYSTGAEIFVWDLEKQEKCEIRAMPFESKVLKYMQIFDAKLFAGYTVTSHALPSGCESNSTVIVWDLKNNQKIGQFDDKGYLTAMSYTGTQLLTASKRDYQLNKIVNIRNFELLTKKRKRKDVDTENSSL